MALSEEPEINQFEDETGHATLAQIESFLMSETLVSPYVHWGKIADLYNTSDLVQQKAVLAYFALVLNRELMS